ncbi:TetR/AcrR family transcriptional regulator [Methylobacterium sp. J-070]|uniref:TetR/AcrR family transcriptional regulator n=1 Tax=Methylobacterium sp. J-070 TaxID=2836650 RepID=UPI002443E12C|nr:TetR/AcrR family transcriptional regulator [Methylobacterium sp. J-070]
MERARWRRRSAERPAEIVDAALSEFARRGFAAARMADIAAQAGLSKAALYVYFPTKAELFRAVLVQHAAPQVGQAWLDGARPRPFRVTLAAILDGMTTLMQQPEFRRLARMVIAESANFPELATLWRENVVDPAIGTVSGALSEAQAAREVRAGDARLMAFAVVGPLLTGMLWGEVMEPSGGEPIDLQALARQHGELLRRGLLSAAD